MAPFVAIAIGLTAAARGLKAFGEEKFAYRRESAVGHNRFVYYFGKLLSVGEGRPANAVGECPLLSHIPPTLHSEDRLGRSFRHKSLLLLPHLLPRILSRLFTHLEGGPLVSVVASLIVGMLSGTSPQLGKIRSWH